MSDIWVITLGSRERGINILVFMYREFIRCKSSIIKSQDISAGSGTKGSKTECYRCQLCINSQCLWVSCCG